MVSIDIMVNDFYVSDGRLFLRVVMYEIYISAAVRRMLLWTVSNSDCTAASEFRGIKLLITIRN
jgi:hypothetical protein